VTLAWLPSSSSRRSLLRTTSASLPRSCSVTLRASRCSCPGRSCGRWAPRWTFGDDGVEIELPSKSARAEWSEFSRWRQAAGCYLLSTSTRDYVTIAARDIREDRRADFEALLTAHVGEKRG
jgi:YcxB-like protein